MLGDPSGNDSSAPSVVVMATVLGLMVGAVGLVGRSTSVVGPARAAISPAPAVSAAARQEVAAAYAKLPLSFEANVGQADPKVRFVSHPGGQSLFLTATEAVLTLSQPKPTEAAPAAPATPAPPAADVDVLRIQVQGAHADATVSGAEPLPGVANYLTGNDPARWHTNVPTYSRVQYRGVRPGMDLTWYGNGGQLEYDLVLAPGVDPASVRLDYQGAEELSLGPAGELLIRLAQATLTQQAPVAYQEVAGVRRPVPSGYVLAAPDQVGFSLGAYDPALPLTIDPVLAYSTYLGGNGEDAGNAIAVDWYGNTYLAGETESVDFPTANALQPASGDDRDVDGICLRQVGQVACRDAFVAKLNPAGDELIYSTYVGGSGFDLGTGIAVRHGKAYLAGTTDSEDFPTANALQPSFGGGDDDAFVAKLSREGNELVYSTYLGGPTADSANGIGVDGMGNAYFAGGTDGDFPTTANALQPTFGGGIDDAFVSKVNPTGDELVYSTYLGGSGADPGLGIAVSRKGDAYVTGETDSTDFPTVNALQPAFGGERDAFVAKLDREGGELVYSTYLGGGGAESGYGIAVRNDKAYVTGETSSDDFPTAKALQPTFGGAADAFVAKLDREGDKLVYSTYLGGSGADLGLGIAVDGKGKAYLTGGTESDDFPTRAAPQPTHGGAGDAFVAKLDREGDELVYSTYLGGSAPDAGNGVAVDRYGNVRVIGEADSDDFPTANALQDTFGGGGDPFGEVRDAFVAKITR